MNDKEFIAECVRRARTTNSDALALLIRDSLDRVQIAQLKQLVHSGPVWAGDVMCKSSRDFLESVGLAVRVFLHGSEGYTAATSFAGEVLGAALSRPRP